MAMAELVKTTSSSAFGDLSMADARSAYLSAVRYIERLHRQFLELIDMELDRMRLADINNVQSLILFNIGEDEATIGELITRGYYLGSNVSYNVRKLVEAEYLQQERSTHDRRSSRVRLSDKGMHLYKHFQAMFDQQITNLQDHHPELDLTEMLAAMRTLGEFWTSQTLFSNRLPMER